MSIAPAQPMDEAATRRQLVEKAMRAAGWSPIVDYHPGVRYENGAVREYETANGPADYLLFHRGEPLAVVEAKRVEVAPQNVLEQAKRYARGVHESSQRYDGYRVPFVYATNGLQFWFQDLREPRSASRPVAAVHTPTALQYFLHRDVTAAEAWLRGHPVDGGSLYPYQQDAVAEIEEAILAGKRRMLVAMATGTGKTRVALATMYRLLKSGHARRILFLVDRRALAAQAVAALSTFEPEPGLKFDKIYEAYSQHFRREDLDDELRFEPARLPTKYLTDPAESQTYVYVCTIQRMRIYLFGREGMFETGPGEVDMAEEDADRVPIPIHAFDVVIADECHRGYTATEESKWRGVLDHFDAINVGLTATPAAHTAAYFGEPVYRYDYERAVREGYLVDYDAVEVKSDITMRGLFLREGEEVELVDPMTGQMRLDRLEDERAFETAQLELGVTAPDRNRKIVQEFAQYARDQEQQVGRFPKTLVFAVQDLQHVSHADQLVRLLREEFRRGDSFVKKITGNPNVDRPLQLIREFRNRPEPAIVVTVDMLTTGVDIRALENLLFVRPVKSRILFEQMLGRGTRKCEEIRKTHFTVFDAVGVLDYFRKASAFTVDPPDKPTRGIAEVVEAIYQNQDREYNIRVLVKRLLRIAKNVAPEGREQFKAFLSEGDVERFAQKLPERLRTDWDGTIHLLRDPGFLHLLEHYPRVKRVFMVAPMAQDRVASEYIFRTTDGREFRPPDYLLAFQQFVRQNPDHITALQILLERPEAFRTEELRQLREKLAARPERFTEENLRRAYQHQLADIISIIRHAAKGEPLLAAKERVERAMMRVRGGKSFTPTQEQWLQLIQSHLIENLVVEEPDFHSIPFSRYGGWTKANVDFQGQLSGLLTAINVAMAS